MFFEWPLSSQNGHFLAHLAKFGTTIEISQAKLSFYHIELFLPTCSVILENLLESWPFLRTFGQVRGK